MDIVAKHSPPDENGARIAELDERAYRERLWSHTPITDFWQVGHGIERALAGKGIYTMGDIARCSIGGEHSYYNEELLYKLFGVKAELLIDHAWGHESCTMADIKAYRPSAKSVSTGQVLSCPYGYKEARLIVREMAELLSLDLVAKGVVTDKFTLTVGYDHQNVNSAYRGEIVSDYLGRAIPRHAHGTVTLPRKSSSTKEITEAYMTLFEEIIDTGLTVRRINLTAQDTVPLSLARRIPEQISMFDNARQDSRAREEEREKKERRVQSAILDIKARFGKNAIIKGMNLEEGGTTVARNGQIGGHRA
jgi:DNA polymerase V